LVTEFPSAWIRRLPKTDLHCHLDGSLRPETLLELGMAQGVPLPADNVEDLTPHLTPPPSGDLTAYLALFDLTLSVMQTEESLSRVAYELAADAAAENVRYLEVRYSPVLHQQKGLGLEAIVDAVLDGLKRAGDEFGIQTGVILCGIRSLDPATTDRLADLTLSYWGRGVVAFDLAGAERNFPAKHHLDAFYRIRNASMNLTIHAGEAFGAASIHQALHYCGAHRIGHGTRLGEDSALLSYVNDHRVGIEVCLTSNVQTGAVDSIRNHPFRGYFRDGLRVSLHTDNRLISATDCTQELGLAIEAFDLGLEDIRRLTINGFKSAFLPHEEKKAVLREAVGELDQLFAEIDPGHRPDRTFL